MPHNRIYPDKLRRSMLVRSHSQVKDPAAIA